MKCDVTDVAQVDAAFAEIEEALGPVEVLVSNAGITADMLVLRMSEDDFTSVLDANLVGGFRVAKRAVQKMMRARWGRIIFLGSVVGATGQAGQANYAASKAGLVGLARSLAREFASRNITVNVVAPGPVATDMFDAVSDDARARDRVRRARSDASPSPTRWPPPCCSWRATPPATSPARSSPSTAASAWAPPDRRPRPATRHRPNHARVAWTNPTQGATRE